MTAETPKPVEVTQAPTHYCVVCAARWVKHPDDTWSVQTNCGPCCDNVPMDKAPLIEFQADGSLSGRDHERVKGSYDAARRREQVERYRGIACAICDEPFERHLDNWGCPRRVKQSFKFPANTRPEAQALPSVSGEITVEDRREQVRYGHQTWHEVRENGRYLCSCCERADADRIVAALSPAVSEADGLAGRVLDNPKQIPPFISVPEFEYRTEERAVINGCLFLRADFAKSLRAQPSNEADELVERTDSGLVADMLTSAAHQPHTRAFTNAQIIEAFVALQAAALRAQPSNEAGGNAGELVNALAASNEGYKDAFYQIAELLGLPAQAKSPREVFETQIFPALKAALNRQPSNEAEGWRDIASAPKDGTEFLAICCPGDETYWLLKADLAGSPYYDDGTGPVHVPCATHWRPLPAAPGEASVQAGGEVDG